MQVHGETLWEEAEQAQQWQTLPQKDVVQLQDQTWPKESGTTLFAVHFPHHSYILKIRSYHHSMHLIFNSTKVQNRSWSGS